MRFQLIGSRRRNLIALCVFVVVYVTTGVLMATYQERLVYYPLPQDFHACKEFEKAEKIERGATRMYFRELGQGVGVIYHGNAGSACDRNYLANFFEQAGISYLVVEYTGYSNDPAKPSHEGVKANVRDVVDYLKERQFEKVTVLGESIGTGAAAYHASLLPPEKLVLVSPFTNLTDIAKSIYWWYPVKYVVNDAYDNVAALSGYDGDALVIHGDSDEIIPHKLGQELFDSLSSEKKTMKTIEGAGHNTLFADDETYTAISSFLAP